MYGGCRINALFIIPTTAKKKKKKWLYARNYKNKVLGSISLLQALPLYYLPQRHDVLVTWQIEVEDWHQNTSSKVLIQKFVMENERERGTERS